MDPNSHPKYIFVHSLHQIYVFMKLMEEKKNVLFARCSRIGIVKNVFQ